MLAGLHQGHAFRWFYARSELVSYGKNTRSELQWDFAMRRCRGTPSLSPGNLGPLNMTVYYFTLLSAQPCDRLYLDEMQATHHYDVHFLGYTQCASGLLFTRLQLCYQPCMPSDNGFYWYIGLGYAVVPRLC